MSTSTTILCLANSRKFSGHCIAGKEIRNGVIGPWIRPVSSRKTGELSDDDCSYADGEKPSLLDVMAVPLRKGQPDYYHSENYLIDENNRWKFIKKAAWSDVFAACDFVPGALWANGSDSSNGKNDRVPEPIAKKLNRSLFLIRPHGFSIQVSTEGNERKIRGSFTLNTIPYKCVVTDPIIEKQYSKQRDGVYPLNNALLCISLGELYFGYAYKLVAAVLTPEKGA